MEDLEWEEIEIGGVGDVENLAEAFGEERGRREDREMAMSNQGKFEG